jgi:ATP-binding cassette subfamily B protein/subfamily B ATP-binding cassette protein MsbA
MIITIPVSFLVNSHNAKSSKANNEKNWQNNKEWGNWIYDSGASWREIRALGMEDRCEEVFGNYSNKYQRLFRQYTQLWVTRRFVIPKIKDEFLMQFLLYFLGGIAIYYNYFTIGQLLILGQYYLQLSEALKSVVSADNDLQIHSIAYNRVLDAIEEDAPDEKREYKEIENYRIEIDNVTFRYKGAEFDVLKNFSLTIEQGERVGIVGESGRGKTTLLHLMTGMLEPIQGEIGFGNHLLSEVKIQDVHKKIGFVFQDSLLFNASIKENMLYGKADATDEEIELACKKAYISDFIQSLPDKYDTIVGEKGIKLSGGQKQRIVLARLFLKDVDVFILDEATSALDQNAESMIQDALNSIGADKTIVIVSHRENSLKLCQRLVYL